MKVWIVVHSMDGDIEAVCSSKEKAEATATALEAGSLSAFGFKVYRKIYEAWVDGSICQAHREVNP